MMKTIRFYTSALLLLAVSGMLNAQETPSPLANGKAIVISGNARFTVLTPELIRMEWSSNGVFTDDASLVFINRNLPVPKYRVSRVGKAITITTDRLELTYTKNSGKFTPGNLKVKLTLKGRPVEWRPGMRDTLNLKGTFRTLDGVKGGDLKNLEDGILSRSGWALIDDSQSYLFDGDTAWNWVKNREPQEIQDWYFFGYGHDYKKALYDYTRVAGRIPMPPLFAFGYWYSRYWTYSDQELKELVESFRRFDIPLDVLVIDMDWHETFGNLQGRDQLGQLAGWTGYTWNRNLFPDPARFLKWTDQQGIKTSLNLHPASGIPSNEENYEAFCREYGWDYSQKRFVPFRITDKKWVNAYFNTMLDPISRDGVDFWWLDWQQYRYDSTFTRLSNTWWLNYVFYTRMENSSNRRPLLYHRWGGLGNHRYQIGFSGDVMIDWSSLAFQIPFTSTASNVGYGYWSHDIGGHQYEDHARQADPEIYTRWIQFGAFSPILRTHATKGAIERRIFKYPDHFEVMREAIITRYRLVPYLYRAAREAYDTGVSMVRPMYYDYPNETQAYKSIYQYMLGSDLLVAPVASPLDSISQLSKCSFWLPALTDWYELCTGTMYKGGNKYEKEYALNEYPVLVKAGTILPMFSDRIRRLDHFPDTLVLAIIPGGNSETTVYEDDGNSNGYKDNLFATTKITKEWIARDSLRVTIHPRSGNYPGMSGNRCFELRFPKTYPVKRVVVGSKEVALNSNAWLYMGGKLENVIWLEPIPNGNSAEIVITFTKGDPNLLEGKLALFSRLPNVCNAVRMETAKRWPGVIPNEIFRMEQIPTMISYEPHRTAEFLEYVNENYQSFIQSILDLQYADPEKSRQIVQHLPKWWVVYK